VDGWSKKPLYAMRASSHVRWELNGDNLRLNTNMSITQLLQGDSFSLKGKVYFALSWSSPFQEDLARTIEDYLKETERYWDMWVKHCSIPMLFQEQTIRSALTLKLHCYEDTGAILAALTTSLPEEVGGVRNWDYRFCWLRDAYFVLSALNNLGHFEEMEGFLRFLLNTAAGCDIEKDGLGPVYTLDHRRPVPERLHENWQGFHGSQPVRSNNQAGDHVQNDVYGEMVLSLTPIFFDERFFHFRSMDYERLLESLVRLCAKTISQPDAGLWELRGGWNEHTFSNLTCWAGLERAQRLQKLGFLRHVNIDVNREVQRADQALRRAVQGGSLRNSPTDPTFDASLLLLPVFRYPDEALCQQTVLAIHEALRIPWNQSVPSPFLYRYLRHDDFGTPESAFMICSFWLVQSLARIGRKEQGIEILKNLLPAANHLGLFSEHFDPKTKQQLGNFPQAYSHVGQINATFAVSPLWSEIL
jgi:GH15 family glucan-1,4-alpha-glucosidase